MHAPDLDQNFFEIKMGRVVLWQLVVAVIVALIAVPIGGNSAGIASILAGLSCVIPNGIFFLGFILLKKFSIKIARHIFCNGIFKDCHIDCSGNLDFLVIPGNQPGLLF